ncbi:hypothetical protein QAD02_002141 [Eretmocerus hayati]|uniref:Uncharacterized protein n=1 Tax=Eretmocerus hayati TaxID=131215 RepID=A0ACC2NIF2_9HYME|nr:hypothetical protein QAD02_002141 [Eretmocerus hayati]
MEPEKGLSFNSNAEFEEFMRKYQTATKQVFVTGKSVRDGPKNGRKKTLKEGIEFHEKNMVCKHGKREHKSEQKVRQTRTVKVGCQARVKVHASRNGDYLVISQVSLEHTGHMNTDMIFQMNLVPEVRRLNDEQLKWVEEAIALKPKRPKLRKMIRDKFKDNNNEMIAVIEFLKTKGKRRMKVTDASDVGLIL